MAQGCVTGDCGSSKWLLGTGAKLYVNFDNAPNAGSTWLELNEATDFKVTNEAKEVSKKYLNGCERTRYTDVGKVSIEFKYENLDPTRLVVMNGGLANFTQFDGTSPVA